MNTATRLGTFGVGLAAVFAVALGAGNLTGPVGATDDGDRPGSHGGGHGGGNGGSGGEKDTNTVPAGLQITQDGYTLVPATTALRAGERTDFRFTVNGPDGRPVTRYTPLHGKELHLIIARRDLSGFQHVHPERAADGTWSIPVTLPDAGTYRFFTDVHPQGAKEQLTLGADIDASGDVTTRPLPAPERVAKVDGYEVRLDGTLVPGTGTRLTLTVSKGGKPVTDLEEYLEAYGHLVVLRAGDLAYLHVHPEGEPGKTPPGPQIGFYAEAPSAGTYRLYLDFQHEGKVRTAEFTVTTGAAPAKPSTPPSPSHGTDGHGH